MTDRDSLLAAIVADPDSPVPRLVFADYLDEIGDHDWAELIRLQNGYFKHWTNLEEQREREAELVEVVSAKFPRTRELALGPPVRGFPETALLVDVAPPSGPDPTTFAVLDSFPITWFDLSGGPPDWFVYGKWLRRARVVDLSTQMQFSPGWMREMYDQLDPARLRSLIWRDADLDDGDAAVLANASTLAGLTELSLSGNLITEDGGDDLIRSPYLQQLEYLDMSGNLIADARRLERHFGPALRLA